jgi:murein DD-endopeptidase MepM/ murein hydrolase activator NlpD
MAQDKFKGANFPNYFKNVVKSVAYTADDVIKTQAPALSGYASTNAEVTKAVTDGVKNIGRTVGILKRKVDDSSVTKDVRSIMKNAVSDALTGKFYNKERMDAFQAQALGDDVGWDDFGDFEDSFGDMDSGESKSSKKSKSTKTKSGDVNNVQIVNNVMKSASFEKQAKLNVSLTRAQIANDNKNTHYTTAVNAKFHEEQMNQYGSMNENLGKMVSFSSETIAPMIEKTLKFYDDSITQRDKQIALLQELSDMQKMSLGAREQKPEKESERDKVMDINGILDVKEYGKLVLNNTKNYMEQQAGISFDFLKGMGVNPLKEFAASPLASMTKILTNKLLPDFFKNATSEFNKTIENIAPSLLMKMNMWKNDSENPMLRALGNIFGIKMGSKRDVNIGNYERGPVPFDGVTKKAITDVIPKLLSKIYSGIMGLKDEIVVDYDKGGAFQWKSEKEKEFNRMKDSQGMSEFSDFHSKLDDQLSAFNFQNSKEAQAFQEDYGQFKLMLRDLGELYNPKAKPEQLDYLRRSSKFKGSTDIIAGAIESLTDPDGENDYVKRSNRFALNRAQMDADSRVTKDRKWMEQNQSLTGYAQVQMDKGLTRKDEMSNGVMGGNSAMHSMLSKIHSVLVQGIIVYPKGLKSKTDGKVSGKGKKKGKFSANTSFDLALDPEVDLWLEKRNKEERRRLADIQKIEDDARKEREAIDKQHKKEQKKATEQSTKQGVVTLTQENASNFDTLEQAKAYVKSANHNKKATQKKNKKDAKDDPLFGELTEFFDGADNFFQKLHKVYEKPFRFASKFLGTMDQKFYEVIYGKDAKGDHKGGMVGEIVKGFRTQAASIWDRFKDKFLDKFVGRVIGDKEKGIVGVFSKSWENGFLSPVREKAERGMDAIFGTKGADGKRIKNGFLHQLIGTDDPETIKRRKNSMAHIFGATTNFWTGSEVKDADGKVIYAKNANSVFGNMKEQALGVKSLMGDYLFGKKVYDPKTGELRLREKNGLFDVMSSGLQKGFNTLTESLFGKKPEKSQKDFKVEFKKHAPGAVRGASIGLIAGMFLPTGPILGAAIGAGLSLAHNTGALDRALFGKRDDKGRLHRGIFAEHMREKFKEFGLNKELAPKMVAGGALGLIGGMFVGGPMMGMLVGSGLSMVANSESLKKALFGDVGKDGKRVGGIVSAKFQKAFPKMATGAGIGALTGLFLPHGPVVGAIMGTIVGQLTANGMLKKLLWGDYDKETGTGKRGLLRRMGTSLINGMIRPINNFFSKNLFEPLRHGIKKNLLIPMGGVLKGLGREMGHSIKTVFKTGFGWLFKNTIGFPLMRLMNTRLLKPFGDKLKEIFKGGFFSTIGKGLKFAISKPFEIIGLSMESYARNLDARDAARGGKKGAKATAKRERAYANEHDRHDVKMEKLGKTSEALQKKRGENRQALENETNRDYSAWVNTRKYQREINKHQDVKDAKFTRKERKGIQERIRVGEITHEEGAKFAREAKEREAKAREKVTAKLLEKHVNASVDYAMSKRNFPERFAQLEEELTSGNLSQADYKKKVKELDAEMKKTREMVYKDHKRLFGVEENGDGLFEAKRVKRATDHEGWKDNQTKVAEENRNRSTQLREKIATRDVTYSALKGVDIKDARRNDTKQAGLMGDKVMISADLEGIKVTKQGVTVGKNIVDGIIKGLKDSGKELKGDVKDLVNETILKTVRSEMGIKSPSRKMMEIAKYTIQGFVKGIKDNKGEVKEAMEGMSDEAMGQGKDGWMTKKLKSLFEPITRTMKTVTSVAKFIAHPIKGTKGAFAGFGHTGVGKTGRALGRGIKGGFGALFGGRKPQGPVGDGIVGEDVAQQQKEAKEKAQHKALLSMSDNMEKTAKNTGFLGKLKDLFGNGKKGLFGILGAIGAFVLGFPKKIKKTIGIFKTIGKGVSAVARGIGKFGKTIGKVMGKVIKPVVKGIGIISSFLVQWGAKALSLLAKMVGLGGISDKLGNFSDKVRDKRRNRHHADNNDSSSTSRRDRRHGTDVETSDNNSRRNRRGNGRNNQAETRSDRRRNNRRNRRRNRTGGRRRRGGGLLSLAATVGGSVVAGNGSDVIDSAMSVASGDSSISDEVQGYATDYVMDNGMDKLQELGKRETATQVASRTARNVAGDAASSAGAKGKISSLLTKLMSSKPVQKAIGSKAGKKLGSVISKAMAKISAKAAPKLLGRIIGKFTPLVGPALIANSFVTGMTDAKKIFGISPDSEATWGMRTAAGFGRTLSDFTLGLIDERDLSGIIYKLFANDKQEASLAKKQDKLDASALKAGMDADTLNEIGNRGAWKKAGDFLGFSSKRKDIKKYKDDIEKQLEAAKKAGDTKKVAKLEKQLAKLDKTYNNTDKTWWESGISGAKKLGDSVSEGFKDMSSKLRKTLSSKGIIKSFKGFADNIKGFFEGIGAGVNKLWDNVSEKLPDEVKTAVTKTKDTAKSILDRAKDWGKSAWNKVFGSGGPALPVGAVDDEIDTTAPTFRMPVAYGFKKTSDFGIRSNPFGGGKAEGHGGVDWAAPEGTPVMASADGVVTFAGGGGSYGNVVYIKHSNGMSTRYAHNSKILVKKGQKVKQGETIAQSGSSGRSTGPHVHFEVLKNGKRLDPMKFVKGNTGGTGGDPGMLKGKGGNEGSIADTAQSLVGKVKYVFGATDVANGTGDCSSFTQYVYKKAAGIDIGRDTRSQVAKGTEVKKGDLKPGDLIFFQGTYRKGVSHVGISLGGNDFIHNSSSKGVVQDSLTRKYWVDHWMQGRRLTDKAGGYSGATNTTSTGNETTTTTTETDETANPIEKLLAETGKFMMAGMLGKEYKYNPNGTTEEGDNPTTNGSGIDVGNADVAIGALSRKYETGNRGPGTVSSGAGDRGGVSYGSYQFPSYGKATDNAVTGFMENTLKSMEPDLYKQLKNSGAVNSAGFKAKWKEIGDKYKDRFLKAQHVHTAKIDYNPAKNRVEKTTGVDFDKEPVAVQAVLWSTATQHGGGGANKVYKNAGINSKMSDTDMITKVYDERGANHGGKYFPSSSKSVQNGVYNRFQNEKKDALEMLGKSTSANTGGPALTPSALGFSTIPYQKNNPTVAKVDEIHAKMNDYHSDMAGKIQKTLDADHIASGSAQNVPWDTIIGLLEKISNSNDDIATNTGKVANEGVKVTNSHEMGGGDIKVENTQNNSLTRVASNGADNNVFLGKVEQQRQRINDALRNQVRKVASGNN